MDVVRFGVVGLGNIGDRHARALAAGDVPRGQLAAVCSPRPTTDYGVPHFASAEELVAADLVDALLIATPTHTHVELGLLACEHGLHVLIEKPIAMSVAQSRQLLAAAQTRQQLAVMLNQRFHPHYARMKALLDAGAIGDLQRVGWTMTSWYRPDVYYQVSRWRGTWRGEGGGLLLNQCIHNLDVLQWLLGGLPTQVQSVVEFGAHHRIDVEDEVAAILTYPRGLSCSLVASSGEAPGRNLLELVGDSGVLQFDGERLMLSQCAGSVQEHCMTTSDMFGVPEIETTEVEVVAQVDQHGRVLADFVAGVLDGTELSTPLAAGVPSIHLANAILMASWLGEAVSLPIDDERYESLLQQRIATSSWRTPADVEVTIDMESSYR